MANKSKTKGDKAEREAVEVLKALAPDLVRFNARRMLGEGRTHDIGDLAVFDDAAIQVRCYAAAKLGLAVRSAAYDSVVQAANDGRPFALGMAPVHLAKKESVRWLASAVAPTAESPYGGWPGPLPDEPVEFTMASRAVTWLRDDKGPYGYRPRPRAERIALLTGAGAPVLVAPIEAWIEAYRSERSAVLGTSVPGTITPLRALPDPTPADVEASAETGAGTDFEVSIGA